MVGEPIVGIGPLVPKRGTSEAEIIFPILNHHTVGMGPAYFASPTSLDLASLNPYL